MMRCLLGIAALVTVGAFPWINLRAQNPPLGAGSYPTSTPSGDEFASRAARPQAHKVVTGRVCNPEGAAVYRAIVEIANNAGAAFQAVETDKTGEFRVEYNFFDNQSARQFAMTLRVAKKGFQVGHRFVEMQASETSLNLGITLRPARPPDPALLSQADLIDALAPRLRILGPADGLPAKQEKEYGAGVQDFLDRKRLDQAVPRLAKVVKLNPSCRKCGTMLALAELGWGDWDDARQHLARAVDESLAGPKLSSPEPLLVYGVLLSWEHQSDRAIPVLSQAARYAPNDPLVLQELGRAECLEMNWWDANMTLRKALAAGAGPEARFMHAEALIRVGNSGEAMNELNKYLAGRDPKSMPERVRSVWQYIQSGKKDEAINAAAQSKAQARGEQPLDYLHRPPANLPDFVPTPDQKPLEDILAAVAGNVSHFFTDLSNVCSVEKVSQIRLRRNGKPEEAQKHTYRYFLSVPEQKWGPEVEEYRADPSGKPTSQASGAKYMLTAGFVSASLVFHPAYRNQSSFRLLGTQKVGGRKTYVIVYAQNPAVSRLSGSFQYGGTIRPTFTQGIVWVDAESYQITHLTSDLLSPIPTVRLDKESTNIEFAEVRFKTAPRSYWLPQDVSVTLAWNGKLLRNNHTYSQYLIANVQSSQKIAKPKAVDQTAEEDINSRNKVLSPPMPLLRKGP